MAGASTTRASARSNRFRGLPARHLTETTGKRFSADGGRRRDAGDHRSHHTRNAIRPWQFTPDEKGIYAQLSNEHAVVAFDLATKKITRRLDLPVKPGVTAADFDFEAPHHGLALTTTAGRCACWAGVDYAALVRAPELTLIATIPSAMRQAGPRPQTAAACASSRIHVVTICRSSQSRIGPRSFGCRSATDPSTLPSREFQRRWWRP
jgi:hypothetical protein